MTDATKPPTTFDDGATTAPDREELTWELFGRAERELSAQIVSSGWVPDLIIAIARGGLIPAGAIGYAIGVKAMGTVNVEFYTGVGQTLAEPVVLPPLMDASDLPGKKVLVVDDVADSGKTLKMVMELLQHQGLDLGGENAAVDARSAVIYRKPHSLVEPDYCWRVTDKWINFPWSVLPVITASSLERNTANQCAADHIGG
ncbi:phosphoribosyltransferase [Actinomyces sp. 565]|uniref:phosphoribosyltransferase family protein n=1 Tax=Actinomyces sp. 565 TaxID=2057794 RepID=UPI0013A69A95|nr:phosphoribosyltransferase [Actinomyces sp. 565]